MRKVYATALRLKFSLDKVKDEEMRKRIEFDINQTRWFGVLYLSPILPQIKVIEELGFKFKRDKSGKYLVLPER